MLSHKVEKSHDTEEEVVVNFVKLKPLKRSWFARFGDGSGATGQTK